MKSWLLINLVLSCGALLTLQLMQSSPARLRWWLVVAALLAWCLPLQPIDLGGPTPIFLQVDIVPISAREVPTLMTAGTATAGHAWGWQETLILASLLGLMWFVWDFISGRRLTQQWRQRSVADDSLITHAPERLQMPVSIRVLSNSTEAVTTGVLRPTIWLGDQLRQSPDLPLILSHELIHVRRRDNLWLSLVTLIQRLLWWNPLVLLLAARARALLELSCDEQCGRLHGTERYRNLLADLFALRQPMLTPQAGLAFFSSSSLTVQRLRHLGREITMTKRHLATIIALAVLCVFTLVQANPDRLRYSRTSITDENGQLSWQFENVHIVDAVQALANAGGLTVAAHPALQQVVVTMRGDGRADQWQNALDRLLREDVDSRDQVGYEVKGDILLLMPQAVLHEDHNEWLDDAIYAARKPAPPAPPHGADHAVPAPPAPASSGAPAAPVPPAPPHISAELDGVPLGYLAELLGEISGYEATVFPGFESVGINMDAMDQDWRTALDSALPDWLAYRVDSDRLIIGPPELIRPGQLEWIDAPQTPITMDMKIGLNNQRYSQTQVLSPKAAGEGWHTIVMSKQSPSIELKIRHAMLGNDQVSLVLMLSNLETGEVLSTPRLVTKIGETAMVQQSATTDDGDWQLRIEMTPGII